MGQEEALITEDSASSFEGEVECTVSALEQGSRRPSDAEASVAKLAGSGAQLNMLEAALELRRLGFSPIPTCRPRHQVEAGMRACDHEHLHGERALKDGICKNPGKMPLVKWREYQDRSPSEDEITGWFTQWPTANLAVVTGPISGVVVIDADRPEAIEYLEQQGGLEGVPSQRTGRGRHWFLKHPGRHVKTQAGQLGEGIDVRGDKGVAMVAPSLHRSGLRYEWITHPTDDLPSIPSWLMEKLDALEAKPTSQPDTAGGRAKDGNLSDWMPLDLRAIEEGVEEGRRNDLAFRYASRLRGKNYDIADGKIALLGFASRCKPPMDAVEVLDIVDRVWNFEPTTTISDGWSVGDQGGGRSLERRPLRLLTMSEMKNLPPPEPLIDGVLFRDTIAVLVGGPGSYKSFLAIDMALSIASGIDWHECPVRQGPVLYVCAEGAAGMCKRIKAWELVHNQTLPEHAYCVPEAVSFLDAGAVGQLCELIRGLPEPPVFVVIDTLARSMPGGEENSSKDMGLAVAAMDAVRHTANGATVMVLHHVNRAQGTIRGHSSLLGAIDTELKAEKTGMNLSLSCEKQKDTAEFSPIVLAAQEVALPDGQTSLAFLPVQLGVSHQNLIKHRVLELLDEFFGETGATYTEMVKVCRDHRISESTTRRSLNALVAEKIVIRGDGRGAKYRPCVVRAATF